MTTTTTTTSGASSASSDASVVESAEKKSVVSAADVNPNRVLNINVGVLGHVDSGKTSLVKALSTSLSTASLDRSSESRRRGITLDLGFSAFLLPRLPERFLPDHGDDFDALQVTLVDCPGHASLIRTIIGGAQIIDMVLLVIDATKGVQTQTGECIVIAEMTAPNVLVALNKVDLLPKDGRQRAIDAVSNEVRAVLRGCHPRFHDAKMVPVSAAVGGEKVAAGGGGGGAAVSTVNVDGLLDTIVAEVRPPTDRRADRDAAFHFAVDHCFPIRGQGTVVTGTVLSGGARPNDVVEFPHLGVRRKIKSLQMFKRGVDEIRRGDRAGMCLANLDPKSLERGVAATPGAVQTLDAVIALVKRVRYFKGRLPTGSKFHVSVGHATVMATVDFWGARELYERTRRKRESEAAATNTATTTTTTKTKGKQSQSKELSSSSLGGSADIAGLPYMEFDFDEDFLYQEELLDKLPTDGEEGDGSTTNTDHDERGEPLLHWALLRFQTPVFCPLQSLIIGSRLDADTTASSSSKHRANGGGGTANDDNDANNTSCRLAFSGRLVRRCADPVADAQRIRLYNLKSRTGVVCRLGDPFRRTADGVAVRHDVYGHDLFKKETQMSQFVGMRLATSTPGEVGVLKSSFGTAGKFRAHFPAGTTAREGDKLFLRFKRYVHDRDKKMHQTGNGGGGGANDDFLALPEAVPTEPIVVEKKPKKRRPKNKKTDAATATTTTTKAIPVARGTVASVKADTLPNGRRSVVTVAGFFAPEDDVRKRVGWRVVMTISSSSTMEGHVSGSFGKAGKCKVTFPDGLDDGDDPVNRPVELYAPPSTTTTNNNNNK